MSRVTHFTFMHYTFISTVIFCCHLGRGLCVEHFLERERVSEIQTWSLWPIGIYKGKRWGATFQGIISLISAICIFCYPSLFFPHWTRHFLGYARVFFGASAGMIPFGLAYLRVSMYVCMVGLSKHWVLVLFTRSPFYRG